LVHECYRDRVAATAGVQGASTGSVTVPFRVIQRFYRDRVAATAGVQGASTGSVTVLQRFGSDLRLNPHFHMLVLDGGYVRDEATGLVRLHKTPAPSTEDVERVAEQIAIKSAAWLRRQGVEDFQEDLELDDTIRTVRSTWCVDRLRPRCSSS
jgi:hypothetical protein